MAHTEPLPLVNEPAIGILVPVGRILAFVNTVVFNLSAVALVCAALVLTFGVLLGHVTKHSVLWQDEVTIFLTAGAIFFSAAFVQSERGHISINVLDGLLSPVAARRKSLVISGVVFAFCLIFAAKTGLLLQEAIIDDQISSSAWGPPLWIPYLCLTAGMSLLAFQVAFELARQSWWAFFLVLALTLAFLLWHRPPTALLVGIPQWAIGVSFCLATLLAMFSGMPIAFALGVVAVTFMLMFMPAASIDTIAQNFYEELANVTILAIPLFILKGSAIGRSNAGRDLYMALHVWLSKIPGGLGVANTLACGLFAAMSGSSPATCSAIGSAGIPEMRMRGYSAGFAAGIIAAGGTLGILLPPSVTMLLYAVAAEVSLGKLFLAGIVPGVLLMSLFAVYSIYNFAKEKRVAQHISNMTGMSSAILNKDHYTFAQKIRMAVWVAPFLTILTGVMVVLYAGWATPSETAGVGAIMALIVIGIMYGIWRPSKILPIVSSTLKESTMLLLIIGMSLLYAYVMSYLQISQSTAAWIIALNLSKWVLLATILVFVIVLGFFLPPVSIILMTAPIILPPLKAAGFDLVWFGVIMTIVMEMGLIHPPVGLNIFVIKNIAPDIPLKEIMWGTLPFLGVMALVVVLACLFPALVTYLPYAIMGGGVVR
jgi:C4-dicarboxylate transporter, DctM subunit